MGCISFLCAVLLGYLCHSQGSCDVIPLFVQKGNSVTLNVTIPVALGIGDLVMWKFNKTTLLVKFFYDNLIVSANYTERLQLHEGKYSVILKNVQEADSGVYSVDLLRDNQKTLAEYMVTVEAPVSPVELNLTSVSGDSGSCNLTGTCSAQDSHLNITFTCDTQTCRQEGGAPSEASGASLHVYLENNFIICNHSNQISSTKDVKQIEALCPQHAEPKPVNIVGSAIGIAVFGFIVVFIIVINIYQKTKKDKRGNIDSTIYDVTRPEAPWSSVYSMVMPHTGVVESAETGVNSQPESLYAQVQKTTGC